MKKLTILIMLLISIVMFSYGKQNVTTRYFNVECEEQWQANTIMIEDDHTIIYSISLINQLGVFKRWGASGDIVITDTTATSAKFYSNGPLKGRIYYYYDDDPLASCKCGLGSVSVDVYKHFDAEAKYGVEIIGPDCIADGDSVVFSIKPILTANLYAGIGMDLYNWNIFDASSAPYVQSIPYVSGDSSSVTFKVGTMTGDDSISVRIGMANEEYRIVKYLGKAAPKPIVNDTCLPYDQMSFEVNVYNEDYPELKYDWTWSTNWKIQYIDNVYKSRVLLTATIEGAEGNFSVTSSYPEQETECTYASKASFRLTRSWGSNPYIIPVDTVVANDCDFIEFELKDAYLSEDAYPTWVIPNTWTFEEENKVHNSSVKARPINSTSDIDSIIVWEDVCNHRDSAKVYVYIKPAQVLSITDNGCLENTERYTFAVQSLSVGPDPVEYIWVYGNDTIQGETGNSITLTADISKATLSVISVGRHGYPSEASTFNLKYFPIKPDSIVASDTCLYSDRELETTLEVQSPIQGQMYHWSTPEGWNISSANSDSSAVTYTTSGVSQGNYPVSVWATGTVGCSISEVKTYMIKVDTVEWKIEYVDYSSFPGLRQYVGYVLYRDEEMDESILAAWYINGILHETGVSSTLVKRSIAVESVEAIIPINDCFVSVSYNLPLSAPQRQQNALKVQNVQNAQLVAYPNPASDYITLETSFKHTNSLLQIFDTVGNLIRQETITDPNPVVNVKSLPSGTYYFIILASNKQISGTTVIINN